MSAWARGWLNNKRSSNGKFNDKAVLAAAVSVGIFRSAVVVHPARVAAPVARLPFNASRRDRVMIALWLLLMRS